MNRNVYFAFALHFCLVGCDKQGTILETASIRNIRMGVRLSALQASDLRDTINNYISVVSFNGTPERDTLWHNHPKSYFHSWPALGNNHIFRLAYHRSVPITGEFLYAGNDTSGRYYVYRVNAKASGDNVLEFSDSVVRNNYTKQVSSYIMNLNDTILVRLNYGDPQLSPAAVASAYDRLLRGPELVRRRFYLDSL